jgi:hypothetical protein
MKPSNHLLSEISEATRYIEVNYPELTKYLDENPMTISYKSNIKGDLDHNALKEYLGSLKELVKKYKESH